jgi:D-tyrosyl-tRNA(Tyr) deacylase
MIAMLQRVAVAEVRVADEVVGAIGPGLAVFVAVERGDAEAQADRLLERMVNYRVFPDVKGRMNRSLREHGGGLLLVSQFTLAADTRKGNRPSFTPAAAPDEGERLFAYLVERARDASLSVATGRFGADMQVALVNDGPVTFSLRIPPEKAET